MKVKFLITTFCLIAFSTSPLMAEWHPAEVQPGRNDRQERRIDRMSKELSLTPDQKAKMEALFKAQSEKMEALQKELRDKRMAVHQETDAKIEALLSSEQKVKYEEFRRKKTVAKTKRMKQKR